MTVVGLKADSNFKVVGAGRGVAVGAALGAAGAGAFAGTGVGVGSLEHAAPISAISAIHIINAIFLI